MRCARLCSLFPFLLISLAAALPPASGPTFRIAPSALPAHPVLIAYGDTRFTDWRFAGNVTSPWARVALIKKIAAETPDALFITGDIPFQGVDMADYHVFELETEVWTASSFHTFPVLGNHEFYARDFLHHYERGLENWWKAFPFLKGMRWYSVQFGNQVYALCLDSEFDALRSDGAQRIWIDRQISTLPDSIQYVFIFLHHAPSGDYLEGHDGNEYGL